MSPKQSAMERVRFAGLRPRRVGGEAKGDARHAILFLRRTPTLPITEHYRMVRKVPNTAGVGEVASLKQYGPWNTLA